MRILKAEAIILLQKLISLPSVSKGEAETAACLENFLSAKNIGAFRIKNNVWAKSKFFDDKKPTLLLNSHHDTVKPNALYSRDPFEPAIKEEKLFGLGSNDAGASLVSLLAAFLHFYASESLLYNLIWAASAEEEISGADGISLLLKHLPEIDCAIVGEPTLMKVAIAEKGLMVLDCSTTGVAGHAAREEGINAITMALPDIQWFHTFKFDKQSSTLGKIKMSVTQINAGTQHNVVPLNCTFVVDVRTTDAYSNEETLDIIKKNVQCAVVPRSTRLNPSGISKTHPLAAAAISVSGAGFGSSTLSDQALMPFPGIKIGPGDSARSHTADEFVYLQEIEEGIEKYIQIIEKLIQ